MRRRQRRAISFGPTAPNATIGDLLAGCPAIGEDVTVQVRWDSQRCGRRRAGAASARLELLGVVLK